MQLAAVRVYATAYPGACPGNTWINRAPTFVEVVVQNTAGTNVALASAGASAAVDSPVRVIDGLDGARRVLDAFADRPHVFNLGHGIDKSTPIAHVERLLEIVRGNG